MTNPSWRVHRHQLKGYVVDAEEEVEEAIKMGEEEVEEKVVVEEEVEVLLEEGEEEIKVVVEKVRLVKILTINLLPQKSSPLSRRS